MTSQDTQPEGLLPAVHSASQEDANQTGQPPVGTTGDTDVPLDPIQQPDQQISVRQSVPPGDMPGPNIPQQVLITPLTPPAQQARNKRLDRMAIGALCIALVLLLFGASELTYDLTYYQPNQALLSATATANAQATDTVSSVQTQTANFDATDTAREQATAQVYQDIYQQATSGNPYLNESLDHQSSSGWDEGPNCSFKNGSYNVSSSQTNFFYYCTAENLSFNNFALQVDINILQGDYGGIVFRADIDSGALYMFEINESGSYSLYIYTGPNASQSQTLLSGSTGLYQPGQANQLTLIAEGNTFYLYLDQQFFDSTADGTFKTGLIGLIADDYQQPTDVAFNNLKLWLL